MKKIISILSVMLIIIASVWAAVPALASEIPVAPDTATPDVGGCTDHTFGEWSVPTVATCTENSYRTCTCSVCGFVGVEKVADMTGHAAEIYAFDEVKGEHSFTCLNCAQEITESCTLVLVNTQYECATSVINTYKCTVCQNTLTREESPEHNVPIWTPVAGSVQHEGVCLGCKQTITADCVFETVTITADCENGGKRIQQCVCGKIIDETIPALGHNVEAWLHIEGTTAHAGTCTRCLASLNNTCVINNFTPDAIGPNGEITHTGSCGTCNAIYTAECVKGEFASVPDAACHQTTCNACSRIFSEDCVTDESGLTSNNNGTHSGTCAVCKAGFTVNCTPSAFEHVEGTDTHATTCTVCEGAYTEQCEVTAWTPSVKIDDETNEVISEDMHTGECSKCLADYEAECTVEAYTVNKTTGNCEGKCTVCNDTVLHESDLGDWVYDKEANTHTATCKTCKASLSHTVTLSADGWKHVESADNTNKHEAACSVCSTKIAEDCDFEATENSHKNTCKVCAFTYESECTSYRRDTVNSTDATCTEDGKTYYACPICGKRNDSMTITVPKTGHKLTAAADAEITAGDEDHTITYTCTNKGCNYTETKTEAHTLSAVTVGTNGKHSATCTVCKKTVTENCKAEVIPAVAATCTTTGRSEGSKCSVCGAVLKAQTTVSALGHDFQFSSTTATCSKAGKDIFKCTHEGCNETKEVAAAANGKHDYKQTNRVAATASANGYIEYTCKNCTATYREVLTYSVNTGVGSTLAPVAAVVLLSGAAFLGVKMTRKEDDAE